MSYSEKLENWIDHFFIGDARLTKVKQMGGVGWLVNGNMCCGIYEELLVVRVDPEHLEAMSRQEDVNRFNEDAETAENFLSLRKSIYTLPEIRRKYLTHALEYTRSLPPKNQQQ